MICRINPIASTGSTILIMGLVPIKCAALLNSTPVGSNRIMLFTMRCTKRKDIRNNPDKLIRNFFPMDEFRKLVIDI
jgi:hypothetical protein